MISASAWLRPAIAILAVAAVAGERTRTRERLASARALDVAAWETISGIANRARAGIGCDGRVLS